MAVAVASVGRVLGPKVLQTFAARLGPSIVKNAKLLGPQITSKLKSALSNPTTKQALIDLLNRAVEKRNMSSEQAASLASASVTHAPSLLTSKPQAGHPEDFFETDWLRVVFVDSVQNSQLFKTLVRQAHAHCDLLFSDEPFDFFHFIYYCYNVIRKYLHVQPQLNECEFCKVSKTDNETFSRFLIFVYKHRESFAHFFNAYFNTDLALTLEYFKRLKPICSPFSGTYGWDLNLMLLGRLKKTNRSHMEDFVQYHGIIYNQEDPHSIATKALSVVLSHLYRGINKFAFIYSVNKVFTPEHWCGIFIDFKLGRYFFYNSLAKKGQVNMDLFNMINCLLEHYGEPALEFITNYERQQEKSKLCGMYVFHFIHKMSNSTAKRSELFEQTFNNQSALSDEILPEILPQYIHMPESENLNESMMHYFFSLFKPTIIA